MRLARWIVCFAAALSTLPMLLPVAYDFLDRQYPLTLDTDMRVSTEVVDRNGALLRAFATPEGRWRLSVDLDAVDPNFIEMLIAYEDKRFWHHEGVDVLSVGRSLIQLMRHGRIVSGGSTITMQLARLMEPRSQRSYPAKAIQMFRALQIERRLTKKEILKRYLTLAPYGGNLEGVRAASLAWFGKEPRKLLLSQSALLVALPQAPESRRPDRHKDNAKRARDRVLARMVASGTIEKSEVARASLVNVTSVRLELPTFAPHLSEAALRQNRMQRRIRVTLDRQIQERLENVAKNAARRIGANLSVAIIFADAHTGEILAEVGSANYFDAGRAGWVDMTRVARSPGSTLKPFIYGIALEEGLVSPETLISDRPTNFGGYRPRNFDATFQGDVSVRSALQLSLNVPTVALLDSIGPSSLIGRFKRSGIEPVFPRGETNPSLAIGLGGLGVSLADLVQTYAMLANGGRQVTLFNKYALHKLARANGAQVLSPSSAWQIGDILSGIDAPAQSTNRELAYKTGTSYGYRDAWTIGYDGRYVAGVWVGRADNGAVPGITGGGTAAPILFEAFSKSGLKSIPMPAPPPGVQILARDDLPGGLKRFVSVGYGLVPIGRATTKLEIVFPPQGATLDLATNAGKLSPLAVKVQGGNAPFRWITNGKPLERSEWKRNSFWHPDGPGFSNLTIIDSKGKTASVDVLIR